MHAVPAGWVSGTIVTRTQPGDLWELGEPAGTMHVDDSGRDVIMVAGGTGLAPFRSIILDLARRPEPPQVYLFVGGRSPRDLYADDMLVLLADELPWLTIVPVVDTMEMPRWRDDWYNQTRIDISFDPDEILLGTLADVVGDYGAFTNHQVLVCGSPAMTRATVDRLVSAGTPTAAIQYDPIP